ncbi:MAG: 16S rRNA (cytidine(1402)-2'-O)-methyltransferase [Rhodobacteraceae bacterium]|nr:16S rRNA (cytidine(1402)-2'-O)-methyltransferase [Paracoccaceae bacterium]
MSAERGAGGESEGAGVWRAEEGRALPAGLHFVATPIGAARDITLRALDTLSEADILAAEDTRTLRQLMRIHGIAARGRKILAYHDHSGAGARETLLAALRSGARVACVSDAGTPLVSDPGFDLARAAIAEGIAVHASPGPSALLAALTVAGLPTDRFFFAGFLPSAAGARGRALEELRVVPGTLVFFESPRRAADSLAQMAEILGADRPAALCRELTKRFEEVHRAPLGDLAAQAAETPPRGEVVLVVGAGAPKEVSEVDIREMLVESLKSESVRDASAGVAARLGLPRRQVYALALELGRQGRG